MSMPHLAENDPRQRSLPIVFDASTLYDIRPDDLSPEFRLLQRLAQESKVQLLVPELAFRRWLIRQAEPAARALDCLAVALQDLQWHTSITETSGSVARALSELITEEAAQTARTESERWHERRLGRLGLSIVKLHLEDLAGVIDAYFCGTSLSSEQKARWGLPDALVLAGVFRVFGKDDRAIFVCGDERVRRMVSLAGMMVADGLHDLLKLKPVAALHTSPAPALGCGQNLTTTLGDLQYARE